SSQLSENPTVTELRLTRRTFMKPGDTYSGVPAFQLAEGNSHCSQAGMLTVLRRSASKRQRAKGERVKMNGNSHRAERWGRVTVAILFALSLVLTQPLG